MLSFFSLSVSIHAEHENHFICSIQIQLFNVSVSTVQSNQKTLFDFWQNVDNEHILFTISKSHYQERTKASKN